MNRWIMDRWMNDEWTAEWMDGWMDGWTGRWMNGSTDTGSYLALLVTASSPPLLSLAHWGQERSQREDPVPFPYLVSHP